MVFLTLVDGRENIVETDGAFEEGSKISQLGGDPRDNGGCTSSRHVGCDLEGHVRTQGGGRGRGRTEHSKTRGRGGDRFSQLLVTATSREVVRRGWSPPVCVFSN